MAELKIVPDTKESRMARLKREWEFLNRKENKRTVEGDRTRAQTLAEAVADGLEQREIGEGLGLTPQRISQLLRFHRFNETSGFIDISERLFRDYWYFVIDPQATQGKRTPEYRQAYEKEVFNVIARMIEEGKEPRKRRRAEKKIDPTPDRYEENRNFRTNLANDVEHIVETLRPDIEALVKLADIDHPMRASPDWMASHARRLERNLATLETIISALRKEGKKTKSRRSKTDREEV